MAINQDSPADPASLTGSPIVNEAARRFKLCSDWEGTARDNFLDDYRFAHGDSDNGFQWPNRIRSNRDIDSRPCLTMNIVRQHNLQIINEAKQNKSSVAFRATGGSATKDSADLYQAMFRQVEYASNAQAAYETALEHQVVGGWGWVRVVTEYENNNTFDQCFRIRRVKDPLSVYLDMDIQEKDGSDAKYGLVFDLVPDDELGSAYPNLKEKMLGLSPLGGSTNEDSWNVKDHTRVCEYFRKVPKADKLLSFIDPKTGLRRNLKKSLMPAEVYEAVKSLPLTKSRDIVSNTIEWYLIVGQHIVDKTVWPGKYIPLIRVLGEETVIDGVMDRKGHTRAMKDAQRMYNYNALLALDTKIPTPAGWTTVGQLEVGMEVFDEHGNPTPIKAVLPIYTDRECFEITFDNGYKVTTDAGHIWKVEERGKRKAATYEWKTKTICTAELSAKKHFIIIPEPLKLPDQDLPLDPYVLGCWLGDGHRGSGRISGHEDDAEEQQLLFAELGYDSGNIHPDRLGSKGINFTVSGLRARLAEIGVLEKKYVPRQYLRGSRSQRLALLQGLMDTDGHFASAVNQCVFINTNTSIAKAVLELCASLGIKAYINKQPIQASIFPGGKMRISQANYRIQFTASPDVPVFRLARKVQLQTAGRPIHWRRTKRIGIKSIISVPSVPARCITLDTPEHLFLCTEGMIPTHNSAQIEFGALQSKVPWLAAAEAIEEYETMWNTANIANHSVLVFKSVDDEGNNIPPPQRIEPPQASTLYASGMETAFNQMMMTSGQWQNQMGMGGNERTGEAISRRQDQGYTAVFHYANNYADSLRNIGKQFLDMVPKLYDTPRLLRLQTEDGEDFDLEINPGSKQALQVQKDENNKVVYRILNPQIGEYDVQADVGPAYGTRREETVRTMTLLLTQNPELTNIIGDLLLNAMDFKEAQEAARRIKRMVPQQALGNGPTQSEQQLQEQVKSLTEALTKSIEELSIKRVKLAGKDELRDIEVFDAQTKRLKVIIEGLVAQGNLDQANAQLLTDSMHAHLDRVVDMNQSGESES